MTDIREKIGVVLHDHKHGMIDTAIAARAILALPEIAEALAEYESTRARRSADFEKADSMGWVRQVDDLP